MSGKLVIKQPKGLLGRSVLNIAAEGAERGGLMMPGYKGNEIPLRSFYISFAILVFIERT